MVFSCKNRRLDLQAGSFGQLHQTVYGISGDNNSRPECSQPHVRRNLYRCSHLWCCYCSIVMHVLTPRPHCADPSAGRGEILRPTTAGCRTPLNLFLMASLSSIAVSRKANGQLRICLDPTDLNKSIRRCYHKTPTVEEITHKLAGAKVFSKLDAKHGYWSVHLDKASSLLTTFNSPFGRFCYKRMPFGLNVRQDVFQHRMDQILEQCDGVIGIADDIIVFGNSEQSHNRNLHRLMTVAAKTGLMFNSSKCTIKDPHVLFFGMIYDVNGVHPDPSKVKAIKAMPSPTDPIKLREFLGMVTYLSPFIPNLSSHTADLRVLLQKDIDYVWSPSHQQCFEKVRDQIYELQPCDILTPTNPLKYKWMHPYADWVLRSCKMAPRWRMLQRHLAMLRLDTPILNVKCSQLFSAAKDIIPTFTVNISQLRVIISHYKWSIRSRWLLHHHAYRECSCDSNPMIWPCTTVQGTKFPSLIVCHAHQHRTICTFHWTCKYTMFNFLWSASRSLNAKLGRMQHYCSSLKLYRVDGQTEWKSSPLLCDHIGNFAMNSPSIMV